LPGFMAPTLTSRSPSPEPGSTITAGCGPDFLDRVSVPLAAVDHPELADTPCYTNEDLLTYGGSIHGYVTPMVMGAYILIPRSLPPGPKLTLTPICERWNCTSVLVVEKNPRFSTWGGEKLCIGPSTYVAMFHNSDAAVRTRYSAARLLQVPLRWE